MKNIVLAFLFLTVTFSSCDLILGRRIKGNGNIISEQRNVASASKIKLMGSYIVEVTQGDTTSVRIETDENLLPYLSTSNESDWLVIKSKDHENLAPSDRIKVFITTNKLEGLDLVGSGNVIGKTKFSGGEMLEMKITGSGDINLEVNTPKIKSEITGSGNINLAGETKDEEIRIAGHGDYKAENLKAENANVHISGSGDVKIFADIKLVVNIAGSGSVNYRGNPQIEQHIAGSGNIRQIQ